MGVVGGAVPTTGGCEGEGVKDEYETGKVDCVYSFCIKGAISNLFTANFAVKEDLQLQHHHFVEHLECLKNSFIMLQCRQQEGALQVFFSNESLYH